MSFDKNECTKLIDILNSDFKSLVPEIDRPHYQRGGKEIQSEYRWTIFGRALELYFRHNKGGSVRITRNGGTVFFGRYGADGYPFMSTLGSFTVGQRTFAVALNRLYKLRMSTVKYLKYRDRRYHAFEVNIRRVVGDRLSVVGKYLDHIDKLIVDLKYRLFRNQERAINKYKTEFSYTIGGRTIEELYPRNVNNLLNPPTYLSINLCRLTNEAKLRISDLAIVDRDRTCGMYIYYWTLMDFMNRMAELEDKYKARRLKLNRKYEDCIIKCY